MHVCKSCGRVMSRRKQPKLPIRCSCGWVYEKDRSYDNTGIARVFGNCCHLGERVGEVDPKDCGCGASSPTPVFRCLLHEQDTTVRRIPNHRSRRDRSCFECITNEQHTVMALLEVSNG